MALSPAFPLPDPLKDHFALDQLPPIAPWIAEQIERIGRARIIEAVTAAGYDADAPQLMSTWVAAIQKFADPVSDALAA
jgi:hypothetical protein